MDDTFPAFVVEKTDDGLRRGVRRVDLGFLPPDDTLIRVERSGVNYKDGLASIEKGRVARISPLIPGVDLVGTVVSSTGPLSEGDVVIVHGYDLGVAHHGGFAGYARVPSDWVVPLPDTLTPEQAMTVGTAGYTAALSVDALERHRVRPGDGPVLVTGATGGVGSMAVGILAGRGHEVVASTGKPKAAEWLRSLGATEVVGRLGPGRPLESERWAGAVDCVGGSTLAAVLAAVRYGGAVAVSGNTGGADVATTVFPFILRGVDLLGIDSVQTPPAERRQMWQRIGTDLRPPQIDGEPATTIGLGGLEPELDRILAGGMTGRVLVDPWAV